jgi:hypothetical protein
MKRPPKQNHAENAVARLEGEALGRYYAAWDRVDTAMNQTGSGFNRSRETLPQQPKPGDAFYRNQQEEFSEALGERTGASKAWRAVIRAVRELDDAKLAMLPICFEELPE